MVDYLSIVQNELNSHSFNFNSPYSPYSPLQYCFNKIKTNTIRLLMSNTADELSNLLVTPFSALQSIINEPEYISFKIPKRKGGTRDIYAPKARLKEVQKKLNYYLQAYYFCVKPSEIHGFVIHPKTLNMDCNIVENSKIHTQKKYVLNIDLKDFFPNITAFRVKELFMSSRFNYSENIATALALLTTYEGKLPIGAPTSPVISNFICKQLDDDLIDFALNNKLTYSRYADDLTFSTNSIIDPECILGIRNLIEKNKFKINEKKFRLQSSNCKQSVTGITVNEKVNVDRKLLKKIRAMLHDWSKNGLSKATKRHYKIENEIVDINLLQIKFMNRLVGYINFVGQVRGKNDEIYNRFKALYKINLRNKKTEDYYDLFIPIRN